MQLVFRSFGVTIAVDCDSLDFLESLRAELPPGSEVIDRPLPDAYYDAHYSLTTTDEGMRLTRGAVPPPGPVDVADMLGAIEFSIGKCAPDHLFVHAGAVAWRNRVILLPGRSRSGKTSMVRALVGAGALYLSDEYAVVDERGFVHPYPRPLGVREQDGSTRRVPVETLGGTAATKPMPVALVLATSYRADARWRPRRETRAMGLLALLDNTLIVRSDPERTLAFLGQAVARAVILRGVRGDAEGIVRDALAIVEEFEDTGEGSSP